MNKIFKLVFNAARGKMMVVNEATSSIQTGKKAAVTVAVIGALASGVAMAEDVGVTVFESHEFVGGEISSGSHEVDPIKKVFENVKVSENWNTSKFFHLIGGAKVFGESGSRLWAGSPENEANKEYASHVSINKADWSVNSWLVGAGYVESSSCEFTSDVKYFGSSVELTDVNAANTRVVGGGKIFDAGVVTMDVTNTHVKISGDDTIVNSVIGGSFVNGSKSKSTVLKTDTTNVDIGKGVEVTGNVVGGHYQNIYGETASVRITNVKLDGVKLGGKLIGGNLIETSAKKTQASDTDMSSHVEKTNLSVKNSVVGAIYAGDYVNNDAKELASMSTEVDSTSLYVENSTINGDVVGGSHATGKKPISVKAPNNVAIEMVNTTVGGMITSDSIGGDNSLGTSAKSIRLTNVSAKSVKASSGTVELLAKNGKQTIIEDKEDENPQALIVDTGVQVALKTDGITNDKYQGVISKAIVIEGWDYETENKNVSVTMAEGLEYGEVTLVNGKLVEKVNSIKDAMQDIAGTAPIAMARILTNDVRKRLGDLRSAEGTHGVWARYDGGELSADDNYESKFNTIQVGIDTVPTPDAARFGVAFSYTKGDTEINRGDADMDAFSLAAYGTWMADNGMFVDVIGRMATVDNDLAIGRYTGKTDNVLLSLSGEMGWRFNVTDTFYVEPQAELTYTYVNGDNFKLGYALYETDDTDSLVARLGFAAGMKCPNNMGDVYVRASAVHEFLGDTSVKVGQSEPLESDGEDTYVEFGIGAQFNVNKNTYVYADIERTEGAKLEEDWRANVGVRFAF